MLEHSFAPWFFIQHHCQPDYHCEHSTNKCLQQASVESFTLSQPPSGPEAQVVHENISAIPCQPVLTTTTTQATCEAAAAAENSVTTRSENWNLEIGAWLADLKAKRLPGLLNALNDVRSIYTSLNHLILTHRIKELQEQKVGCADVVQTYLNGQAAQLLDVDARIVDEATAVVAEIWKASSFVIAAGQTDTPLLSSSGGQVPIFVGKPSPSTCCDCSRSTSVGASSSLDKSAAEVSHLFRTAENVPPPHPPPGDQTWEQTDKEDQHPIPQHDQQAPEEPVSKASAPGPPLDADVSMDSNAIPGLERQQSIFVDAGDCPGVEPCEECGTTPINDPAETAETAYRIHRPTAGSIRRTRRMPVTRSQTAQQHAKRKRRLSTATGLGAPVDRLSASPAAVRERKRARRGSTPVQRPATAPIPEASKSVDTEQRGEVDSQEAVEEGDEGRPVEVIDCETGSPSPPVEESSRIFCTHHGDVSKTEKYDRGLTNRFICSVCDEESSELRSTAKQRGWPIEELVYEMSSRKWVATFVCKHGHKFRMDHTVVRKQPWCPSCYEANTTTTAPKRASTTTNAQAAWTQAHQRILFATARENLRRTKYADDYSPWLHPAHRQAGSPSSHRFTKAASKKSLYSRAFTDADEDASITIERLIALGSESSPWSVLCIAPPAGGSRKRLRSKDPLYLEARSRYKQWVKRVHPDKNGHRYAKEAFHILDSAWKQIESQVIR